MLAPDRCLDVVRLDNGTAGAVPLGSFCFSTATRSLAPDALSKVAHAIVYNPCVATRAATAALENVRAPAGLSDTSTIGLTPFNHWRATMSRRRMSVRAR